MSSQDLSFVTLHATICHTAGFVLRYTARGDRGTPIRDYEFDALMAQDRVTHHQRNTVLASHMNPKSNPNAHRALPWAEGSASPKVRSPSGRSCTCASDSFCRNAAADASPRAAYILGADLPPPRPEPPAPALRRCRSPSCAHGKG